MESSYSDRAIIPIVCVRVNMATEEANQEKKVKESFEVLKLRNNLNFRQTNH